MTAVECRVTLEVLPRPGPIAMPWVWLRPRDGFVGSCGWTPTTSRGERRQSGVVDSSVPVWSVYYTTGNVFDV